jgi:hypothetical protein
VVAANMMMMMTETNSTTLVNAIGGWDQHDDDRDQLDDRDQHDW